jgi:hypothetical protein
MKFMSKMKIGTVAEVVEGLTIASLGTEINNQLVINFTNGAVLTAKSVSDAKEGLGIQVSVDADWDYGDEEETVMN